MQRNIIIGILLVAVFLAFRLTIFKSDSNTGGTDTTVSPTPSEMTGGSASAAEKVKEFLASELSLTKGDIVISDTEAREWPDGCLGIAVPGVVCTQAITPGYRMRVQIRGVEYFYRTDLTGDSIRMER